MYKPNAIWLRKSKGFYKKCLCHAVFAKFGLKLVFLRTRLQKKFRFSDFCHTTAAELRQNIFFSENNFFYWEKLWGFKHKNESCNSCRIETKHSFCKVNVIFWQNLIHYDKEKVLVPTDILLWGYCGKLLFGSCHCVCVYSLFF